MDIIQDEVTQEDIRVADQGRWLQSAAKHCVVATALRRMLPEAKRVEVGFTTGYIDGEVYRITQGVEQIRDWTFHRMISPFPFTLVSQERINE